MTGGNSISNKSGQSRLCTVQNATNNEINASKTMKLPTKSEFTWWLYASGSSTVAIDNKIEQAMDLVKSHLMFAVREEVEVLKEKIMELTDRISQLEKENSILRAAASQETLAKLPQSAAVTQVPKPTS